MVFGVLFVWTPLSYAEMGYGLLAYWKRVLVGIIVLNCRGERGGGGGVWQFHYSLCGLSGENTVNLYSKGLKVRCWR